jgi:phosphatidylinositol alpha-mannosyltransferase
MFVGIVCPYDLRRPGGVRTHIAGLGRALVERGHRVEVIAPSDAGELETLPVVRCGGARRIGFSGTQIDITWAAWNDVRDVARRGYDLLHFHTIWNPFVPFQIALRFKGPKVATFHDVPGPDTPPFAAMLMPPASALIERAALDATIAVSPSVSRYLPEGRHVVIPNGIRVPALPPEHDRDCIAYVGRLEPRKGVRTLIDAARQLGADCPPIVIAGDGPLRSELESMAPSTVRFVGEVSDDDKWALLRRARLLVAPSLGGESFGIVLLEAMAAGAVPIAADNPGYRAVLAAHAEELLFRPGDASALAARIRDVWGDGAKRGRLQTWGMEYAAEFDWKVLAPRVEAVYERALA